MKGEKSASDLIVMILTRVTVTIALLAVCFVLGVAQDADPKPAIEAEGPAQLLERGRSAFAKGDFAVAEEALEKFIVDYGEAEEVKEAVRIHRPLVAIAKVGMKRFNEALVWIDKSLKDPEIPATLKDELLFWRGICLMTTGELVEAQHAFGSYWAEETHQPFKRYEALLLFATLYIQQDFPSEAADFLELQLPKFRETAPETASRAVVLELYARIQAEEHDKALEVLLREYGNLEAMTQIISFQSLTLKLGAAFQEKGDLYGAISCFQRIWPSEKLRERQAAKKQEVKDRIEVLQQRTNSQAEVFQLKSILKRIEREMAGFEKMENFDSSIRLRLATAFQKLGRFREAALIMEEMLATMPPDPIVENATLTQMQCWMEIGRWRKAVEVADRYREIFGSEGKYLPTVLFLKADALRFDQQFGAAQLAYGKVVEEFPEEDFAAKATFMQGFLYLQQDDNDGALYQFDQVQRNYPDSSMVEDADYWSGMALSYSGLYEECREHMNKYLERWDTPKYRKESVFRIGVATFSLAEYEESLKLLRDFVAAYPGDPMTDEAHLLIGDALFAEGDTEDGFAAYEKVRPSSGRYFEEAWFKRGNAYKLLEETEIMRNHFDEFVRQYPGSSRMPEAVYWVGWTHLNSGDADRAREIYWKTIEELGDDPAMTTVTDLFAGLGPLYKSEEASREDLLTRLQTMKVRAAGAGQDLLASRVGWAKSRIIGDGNEVAARSELMDISKWVDPKLTSPTISVPVAQALLASGNRLTAKSLLQEIRKWHPRTVHKGTIYRALGMIAKEEGDFSTAIEYFEKYERSGTSVLELGEVKLEKARILQETGKNAAAQRALEDLLEFPGVGAESKAQALLELGRSWMARGEKKKAIVYFERVYVAYGKFPNLNAEAYWERGQALESLGLREEALETYEEFLGRGDLEASSQRELAEDRASELRPLFPRPEPTVSDAAEKEGSS